VLTGVRSGVLAPPAQRAMFDAVVIVVFALLMAPAAQAKIEAQPVPYTLQVIFVLLTGLLLGPWRAAAAMGLYAVMGFSGLPVFARGGGPAYFLGPTAGYIYGFVAGAFVTGWAARSLARRWPALSGSSRDVVVRFLRVDLLASLAGVPVIYLFGVSHLALYYALAAHKTGAWGEAWVAGAGVFVWYDVVKAAIAAAIASSAGLRREVNGGNA